MTSPSKQEISEYYADPQVRAAILSQIKNRPVLTVQAIGGGREPIFRRNLKRGVPIQITQATGDKQNPSDLSWFTERRFSEFHPVIGSQTKDVWVDIDPGKGRTTEELKPLVRSVEELLRKFPGIQKTQIAYSGGRGFHVRGTLDKDEDVDSLRRRLAARLRNLPGEKLVTNRPPKEDEVRLDTSTLKETGSIRALHSLNTQTGQVAVPLSLDQLQSFKPQDAAVKSILKKREFAPGIPGTKRVHDLPERKDVRWTLAVQEHDARKAGKHWDLRLVDPDTGHAHSWAVPRMKFPEGNRPLLAVQTPTHTSRYALTFGEGKPKEIREGYGKGTVQIKHKEPVRILSVGADRVKFERSVAGVPEQYLLFRTKDKSWMIRNVSSQDQEKKGATMFDWYGQGYRDALTKLGVATATVGRQPSTSEQQLPLNPQDDQTPAGQLAGAMSQLDDPQQVVQVSGPDSSNPEQRLNRQTTWSSPHMIPSDTASGASPIQPGLGL